MKHASTALAALAAALAAPVYAQDPHAGHQMATDQAAAFPMTPEGAAQFVAAVEKDLFAYTVESSQVNWVNSTYITDDTDAMAARINAVGTEKSVRYALDAAKYAANRLNVPLRVDGTSAPVFGEATRKVIEAGDRLERDLLAVSVMNPEVAERYLHELDDRHFDNPVHRRLRSYLAGEVEPDDELVALRAELDATAAQEGLNDESAKQLFLRLEERLVRRELAELGRGEVTSEDLERTKELQGVLGRIQEALQEVAFT